MQALVLCTQYSIETSQKRTIWLCWNI
jgi:hypothetical protein